MCPEDFEKSLWFNRELLHAMAPTEASTCKSKDSKGIERIYDFVTACDSLEGNISQMKVVGDFESRPHKAVSFVVERDKEIQEWNEQKLPKVLPGYSGRKVARKKALKKQVEKKRRKKWKMEREESGVKTLKK